jgi:hypothetical protein
MSHITKLALAIKNLNDALAKATIDALARQNGLTASTMIRDYYGKTISVLAGLAGTNVRGLGIVKNSDGSFSVIGDDYGQAYKIADFSKQFQRTYLALAYQKAAQALGYRVSMIQDAKGQIAIRAETPF